MRRLSMCAVILQFKSWARAIVTVTGRDGNRREWSAMKETIPLRHRGHGIDPGGPKVSDV
ncbi:hypothetical protein IEQ34_027016 [Dendrobium chrysotoxum]|uniref:Secreted protein n=1 Tax=Dendrobium chrysotoxum TaxID=161865 RepID=A0AAV7FIA9_DENCH|nr:hypothetical protein IEQ34_027016 [Dendrobium chrysotoxum]